MVQYNCRRIDLLAAHIAPKATFLKDMVQKQSSRKGILTRVISSGLVDVILIISNTSSASLPKP
jgi:hypothetical protein